MAKLLTESYLILSILDLEALITACIFVLVTVVEGVIASMLYQMSDEEYCSTCMFSFLTNY